MKKFKMEKQYFALLDELVVKYSFHEYGDYKDGGSYGKLFYYSFNKGLLSINLNPQGDPKQHIELIQSIVVDINNILPKEFKYMLFIDGWYCEIQNGESDLKFVDGRYYIKTEYQEMHERKELATIMDVASLNNITNSSFKWSILKSKSIELGFIPVKDKSGFENLYLIEAFKACYPELKYNFKKENELQKKLNVKPKRKKFWGLF